MTTLEALRNALYIITTDHNETCSCTLGEDYKPTIECLKELEKIELSEKLVKDAILNKIFNKE